MTSRPSAAPLAFSGSRLGWADLPRPVRQRIAELAGAQVASETSATSGFSPGYAALLELNDGTRVFVKAVSPEQSPGSPALARAEVAAAAQLPGAVPAPELLWSHDDGTWVVAGFTAVEGQAPEHPWLPAELERVLTTLADLATVTVGPSAGLPPLHGVVEDHAQGWRLLVSDPAAYEAAVTAVGGHGDWLVDHVDDLIRWADGAASAVHGDTLVHGDLRADNLMLGPDRVWLIDWPHAASGGPAWFDLLAMLPSVSMQGGGDPETIFWSHPNAAGADRDDVRAVLAALTGNFVHQAVQPPPPGIANLRPFQLAQGMAALEWLRRL